MKDLTTKAADNIRILAASMVEKAKSGHPGGAMGGADFVNILYSEFLRYNPDDSRYPFRDRFFLDPGHMSPMLYSVLALAGYFNMDELAAFRQWGSPTPGHPEVDLDRGIENTSGPLGQGHAMALGAAIAERFLVARFGDWMAHKTYAFISDGGIQEEVSQGVGRIAGHLGLSNLIMFYDSNNIQLSTKVEEVSTEDIVAKYEAWGWSVISIDGNDPAEIRQALSRAVAETEKPTLIVGDFDSHCNPHLDVETIVLPCEKDDTDTVFAVKTMVQRGYDDFLLIGVIGADVHAVGNKILYHAFTEAGFDVVNLGVMVSQEEYIEAAIEADADAIVVSSLYGQGELDCRGMREKCDEAGLAGIPLLVGGNIVVGKQDFADVEKRFKAMGFDRAFPPGTPPETTIAALREILYPEEGPQ